ncbi:MAG: HAD family hydrolase [Planctomycetaceae bacterium]|nr:HAD family hydrolase [Planctomycetaceae bacterium]
MNEPLIQIIRRQAAPMTPQPTQVAKRLLPIPNIRAVFFDIYGTMLMSGSGEVGTASKVDSPRALVEALNEVGIETKSSSKPFRLDPTIERHHAEYRKAGIESPEVDILEVWHDTLAELSTSGQISIHPNDIDLARVAVEYETRVNPVWPMPNLENCLDALRGQLELGIISNAQFFTPLLFRALLMRSLEELGFNRNMLYFSYTFGESKPSTTMFHSALEKLGKGQISASETLYIGNDMLNDVATASRAGMKTALFAGDARSLRLRAEDSRILGYSPDLVVTDLNQLPPCVLCN